MLNEPARGLLAKNTGAFSTLLRVEFAAANGLEHIVVRDPGGGACNVRDQIRDRAEEVHPAALVEFRSVFGQPLLDGLACLCDSVLNPAVVGRVEFEDGLCVSGFGERLR